MSFDRSVTSISIKLIAVLAATLVAVAAISATAQADEHEPHDPFADPHPHVLLVHADVSFHPPLAPGQPPYTVHGYERCVDLAGGRALPANNHHRSLHFGRAGEALREAGHLVVPFVSCAQLDAMVGGN
jgi:hypothetical protein